VPAFFALREAAQMFFGFAFVVAGVGAFKAVREMNIEGLGVHRVK
jgi:hypothetical protein